METPVIKICEKCGTPYDWRRSASPSLKMTYCGVICEKADLGFTIEYLLTDWQPGKPGAATPAAPPTRELVPAA